MDYGCGGLLRIHSRAYRMLVYSSTIILNLQKTTNWFAIISTGIKLSALLRVILYAERKNIHIHPIAMVM